MHPMKKEASDTLNAKMRSMTTHYGLGSGPADNITSPQERLKGEAGEAHVGFGADSDNASPKRGDRPARRSMAANPVATYARGGKVKHRDSGGDVSPIEEANKDQNEASAKATGGVIARAKGGRTKGHKGSTHVNVMIAPQGAGAGPMPPAGLPPQLAALAAGAHPPAPPMAPPGPPMGAGPMPPGGPMPPPGAPPMRAKGGKVMGGSPTAPADATEKTLREEGLVRKAKGGGIHMTAGAVTGEGRLQKMGIKETHRGSMKPQEV